MDTKQIRMEIYSNSSSTFSIRLTHTPTGIFVCGTSDKTQYMLKKRLLMDLNKKIERAA